MTAPPGIDFHRQLADLPVLPATLVAMLSLDRASEGWFDDVVRLVSREPTYAVRVLASANSAMYRGVVPVTRIRDAVVRVGASATTDLVASLSIVRVFVPRSDWERSLWIHSITVAALTRTLVQGSGRQIDPQDAYLCGLLHDLGRFILFNEAADRLREVEQAPWSSPEQLVVAERSICGVDHAELGAMAAARWGLPASIVEVIRHHHDAKRRASDPLLALVQSADSLDFFDVSPNHHVAGAFEPEEIEVVEARLKRLLPTWYRSSPSAVAPLIVRAMEEARQDAEIVLPK